MRHECSIFTQCGIDLGSCRSHLTHTLDLTLFFEFRRFPDLPVRFASRICL
jgi:hypothetical protein